MESTQLNTRESEGASDTASLSSASSQEEAKHPLPTFTNEVIIIRPEFFSENVDCQQDNKFMKTSPVAQESTNDQV